MPTLAIEHATEAERLDLERFVAYIAEMRTSTPRPNVLLSSKLLDAMDLTKEDPKVRERYGDGKPYQYNSAPTANDQLLMARCVTLSFGRWESHGKKFDMVRAGAEPGHEPDHRPHRPPATLGGRRHDAGIDLEQRRLAATRSGAII